MNNIRNILFDLILFLVIFPYIYRYNNYFKIFNLIFISLVAVHLWIIYSRYLLKVEYIYPFWWEIISIIYGIIFIVDAYYNNNLIILLFGILIIIGHFNKILCPKCPYYF